MSFNVDRLTLGIEYDYITRTSLNQGVLQETGFVNKENINDAGTWSLGLLQMDFFYRRKPWYAGQFVRKIIPKFEVSESSVLFFTTLLNKQKPKLLSVLVRDVDKTFLNIVIRIPVLENGKIDFDFINSFIAELEAERIKELEAYLTVAGLKDYVLTEEEQKALNDFGKLKTRMFEMNYLLEKVNVKRLKYKTSELPSEATAEYTLPALTAGIQNQGLNNYVPQTIATVLQNVISISANGANTGATFYQSKEFTVLQDAYAIRWKDKSNILSDTHYLYLTGIISKAIYGNYEWTNKAGWERIKSNKIGLPVSNGNIDFEYMDILISAIQKEVIKDVVLFADRKIKATKEIVNKY